MILAPNAYDTLINNQYTGKLRFKEQNTKEYLGSNLMLTQTRTDWQMREGQYNGKYKGHPVNLRGYWIFKAKLNQCIQAVNCGGGPLDTWNKDGHGLSPQDFELFTVAPSSPTIGTVIIYNAAYAAYSQYQLGLPANPDPPSYIGLINTAFNCSSKFANASQFVVEFI